MTTKQPDFADLNSLAIEACDMWQEHLSTLASDPAARADFVRLLEPQRRMFADWASMMQQGGRPESRTPPDAPQPQASEPHRAEAAASPPPAATPPVGAAHGDDPLRLAQLALRLAELEKRVTRLEARGAAKTGASRRTQRAAS